MKSKTVSEMSSGGSSSAGGIAVGPGSQPSKGKYKARNPGKPGKNTEKEAHKGLFGEGKVDENAMPVMGKMKRALRKVNPLMKTYLKAKADDHADTADNIHFHNAKASINPSDADPVDKSAATRHERHATRLGKLATGKKAFGEGADDAAEFPLQNADKPWSIKDHNLKMIKLTKKPGIGGMVWSGVDQKSSAMLGAIWGVAWFVDSPGTVRNAQAAAHQQGYVLLTADGKEITSINEGGEPLIASGIGSGGKAPVKKKEPTPFANGLYDLKQWANRAVTAGEEDTDISHTVDTLLFYAQKNPTYQKFISGLTRIQKNLQNYSFVKQSADSLYQEAVMMESIGAGLQKVFKKGKNLANNMFQTDAERVDSLARKYMKQGMNRVEAHNKAKDEVFESLMFGLDPYEDNPVYRAVMHRLSITHSKLVAFHPEEVQQAVRNVADFVGDVEEIGSSDVSGWVKQVLGELPANLQEDVESLKEVEPKASSALKHRVGVTVLDPNEPMVAKRKEQIQKKVVVTADDIDSAITKAKSYYKKKGYKVVDAWYIEPVTEGFDPALGLANEWNTLNEAPRDAFVVLKLLYSRQDSRDVLTRYYKVMKELLKKYTRVQKNAFKMPKDAAESIRSQLEQGGLKSEIAPMVSAA